MTWAVMKMGKERIYIDFRDVLCLISRGDKATDVYTPLFTEGVTVDHPLENVVNIHAEIMTMLEEGEDEDEEGEDGEREYPGDGDDGQLYCAYCDVPVSSCGCSYDGDSGSDAGLRVVHSSDGGDDVGESE